jgi:hypothetical protein
VDEVPELDDVEVGWQCPGRRIHPEVDQRLLQELGVPSYVSEKCDTHSRPPS